MHTAISLFCTLIMIANLGHRVVITSDTRGLVKIDGSQLPSRRVGIQKVVILGPYLIFANSGRSKSLRSDGTVRWDSARIARRLWKMGRSDIRSPQAVREMSDRWASEAARGLEQSFRSMANPAQADPEDFTLQGAFVGVGRDGNTFVIERTIRLVSGEVQVIRNPDLQPGDLTILANKKVLGEVSKRLPKSVKSAEEEKTLYCTEQHIIKDRVDSGVGGEVVLTLLDAKDGAAEAHDYPKCN
jgi:hypothetical protein